MTKDIVPFEAPVSAKQIQALNAIREKEIPKDVIRERPGKGKKKFSYIDHVWVTETLQDGLKYMWSFETLGWEVFSETLIISEKEKIVRSIVAQVQLTIKIPMSDGSIVEQVITEVGVFEPNPAMSTAMGIASAVSRGLCRAAMRGLGIGIQFYKKDDDQLTVDEAWTSIKKYAKNQGFIWTDVFQEKYLDRLEKIGITKIAANLVDRWGEAFDLMLEMTELKQPAEKMPEAGNE